MRTSLISPSLNDSAIVFLGGRWSTLSLVLAPPRNNSRRLSTAPLCTEFGSTACTAQKITRIKKKKQGGRKHTHTRTKMKVSLLCFSEHVPRTEEAPLSRYREQQRQQQMVPTPPLLLTRGVRQEKKKQDGKKRRPAKRRCVRVSFVPASRPRIYTPFQGRLGNAGKGAQKCAVVASRSGD